jgi:hypothetical protein
VTRLDVVAATFWGVSATIRVALVIRAIELFQVSIGPHRRTLSRRPSEREEARTHKQLKNATQLLVLPTNCRFWQNRGSRYVR